MKIKSWSYSQLSSYEQCPHQHMYKKIVKLPEPESYALTNGNRIHTLAEDYLTGKLTAPIRTELFKVSDIKTLSVKSTYLLITLKGEITSKDAGILIEGNIGLLNKLTEALIFVKDF